MKAVTSQSQNKGKANIPPIQEPGHHQGNSIICLFLSQCKTEHSCLLVSQAVARRRKEERYFSHSLYILKQAYTKAKVLRIYLS